MTVVMPAPRSHPGLDDPSTCDQESTMHALHEELARAHTCARLQEAETARLARRLLAARRAQRRAERAAVRARVALARASATSQS